MKSVDIIHLRVYNNIIKQGGKRYEKRGKENEH